MCFNQHNLRLAVLLLLGVFSLSARTDKWFDAQSLWCCGWFRRWKAVRVRIASLNPMGFTLKLWSNRRTFIKKHVMPNLNAEWIKREMFCTLVLEPFNVLHSNTLHWFLIIKAHFFLKFLSVILLLYFALLLFFFFYLPLYYHILFYLYYNSHNLHIVTLELFKTWLIFSFASKITTMMVYLHHIQNITENKY